MYQSPCLREVLCVQKPHNHPARLRGHAGGRYCLPDAPYLRLFCERQGFCLSHGCRYIAGLLFLRYRPASDGRGRCLWERCNNCPVGYHVVLSHVMRQEGFARNSRDSLIRHEVCFFRLKLLRRDTTYAVMFRAVGRAFQPAKDLPC